VLLAWELLSDVGFVEGTAAVGADLGQRCLVDLVDLLGGRGLAVGLGAIVLARLAAGLAGVGLGGALGEGPGRAPAGTMGGVELPTEALVLSLQVVKATLKGLAAGTPDGLHTPLEGRPRPICAATVAEQGSA
jgi:hypothetical protein